MPPNVPGLCENRSSPRESVLAFRIGTQDSLNVSGFVAMMTCQGPILKFVQTISNMAYFGQILPHPLPEPSTQERGHTVGNVLATAKEDIPPRKTITNFVDSRSYWSI
jgi:hypothetical protein